MKIVKGEIRKTMGPLDKIVEWHPRDSVWRWVRVPVEAEAFWLLRDWVWLAVENGDKGADRS